QRDCMKIVQHMRRDAAPLTSLGLVTSMAAVCAAGAAKAETSSQTQPSSSLGQAIFAPASPDTGTSPAHSPEVEKALAAAAARPAAPARRAVMANAAASAHAEPAPAEHGAAARGLTQQTADVHTPSDAPLAFGYPLPGHAVNSRFGLRQLSFEGRARMHDGV